jgi:hypothetical protein
VAVNTESAKYGLISVAPSAHGKSAFVSEGRFAFVSIHSIAASSSSKDTVAKLVA